MARHMIVLGYPEGSLELLQEGETMAQELKDGNALAYFQSNMGFYYVTSGNDPVKGRKYLEKGLEWSEPTADVGIIAPATSALIISYTVEGNYARVCQVTPKVIALIEKTHTERELFGRPDNIYSALHSFYGLSLGGLGRFAEGEPFLEKGLFFARDMNNLLSIAAVEMNYGIFYRIKGDGEKCVKHSRASIE